MVRSHRKLGTTSTRNLVRGEREGLLVAGLSWRVGVSDGCGEQLEYFLLVSTHAINL